LAQGKEGNNLYPIVEEARANYVIDNKAWDKIGNMDPSSEWYKKIYDEMPPVFKNEFTKDPGGKWKWAKYPERGSIQKLVTAEGPRVVTVGDIGYDSNGDAYITYKSLDGKDYYEKVGLSGVQTGLFNAKG
jgi:hypothetical protein